MTIPEKRFYHGWVIVALVGYASLTWLSGRLFDRYGPRRLFPIGALSLGPGLILSAQARTPWHLYLTWGMLVGQGLNLIGFVPHLTQMSLWFHQRRGLASGLVLSGSSNGPHLGAILGALELGWGLGGFLGSWFGEYWYDHWGSYHGAFALTMGVSLLGCLTLWLAAPRHSRRTVSLPAPLREEVL
jgi:MFS family permease